MRNEFKLWAERSSGQWDAPDVFVLPQLPLATQFEAELLAFHLEAGSGPGKASGPSQCEFEPRISPKMLGLPWNSTGIVGISWITL